MRANVERAESGSLSLRLLHAEYVQELQRIRGNPIGEESFRTRLESLGYSIVDGEYGEMVENVKTISVATKQHFSAALPNTVWLADITYLPTGEGWLYLAAVLDLATRKIVGWSMREHMRTELTSAALMMATQRQRPGAGLICHSDRGSQYAAEAYRAQLVGMKAIPSMSRTGCCYDNAPMESFFHTLKVELVHQRRWATREEARRDLFAFIEGYYNRQRIHSALGDITPEQAERNAS
ncbi:IS3 family transposase [Methylobacterium sp. 77]|uniref:IS3 family transposase n=1 Tax=Methylobacterium sp. 77 TaxID=1101192 RepID=UPI001FD8E6CE|nr:IS3 family transposase [Methylobacterium sp. 77]